MSGRSQNGEPISTARKARSVARHDMRACYDPRCASRFCQLYRDGYDDGFIDGYGDGYSDGRARRNRR